MYALFFTFFSDVKSVKNKNILCTSCNGSLKELILKGKPNIHPFMDTLLCEVISFLICFKTNLHDIVLV